MRKDKKAERPLQTFKLCHTNDCCPVVEVYKQHVIIRDDFGGSVRLSREEYSILLEKK